ncbi:hypothetical protein QUB17_33740 [Microcoleus sp. B5-C4]
MFNKSAFVDRFHNQEYEFPIAIVGTARDRIIKNIFIPMSPDSILLPTAK